jgi:biotin transport system substrate-specific component
MLHFGRYITIICLDKLTSLGGFGLPFFSGASHGWRVLYGLTSGYIWGFLLASIAAGVLCRWGWDRRIHTWICVVIVAELCIFSLGFLVLAVKTNARIAWQSGVVPFIVSEVIKSLITYVIIPLLWRAVSMILNLKNQTTRQYLREFLAIV